MQLNIFTIHVYWGRVSGLNFAFQAGTHILAIADCNPSPMFPFLENILTIYSIYKTGGLSETGFFSNNIQTYFQRAFKSTAF